MSRREKPERRDAIEAFVRSFQAEHGYGPTVREVAAHLGLGPSVTHHHLLRMREQGRVTWKDNWNRTLRVTP